VLLERLVQREQSLRQQLPQLHRRFHQNQICHQILILRCHFRQSQNLHCHFRQILILHCRFRQILILHCRFRQSLRFLRWIPSLRYLHCLTQWNHSMASWEEDVLEMWDSPGLK